MIISIGGSIGSGKSTVLSELKKLNYDIFFEPVSEWTHLNKFYEDPKRWAFTFQIEILYSFLKCKRHSDFIISERSPYESYQIFSKQLLKQKILSNDEFNVYKNVYDELGWSPDIFIYLKTDPHVCLQRIKQRNRECECNIDISYLQQLHESYETMYKKNTIIIDANKPVEDVLLSVLNVIQKFA